MTTSDSGVLTQAELQAFERMRALISDAREVALSGHVSPDGDALGSELAMGWLVSQLNPQARVTPLLAGDRAVPPRYAFLEGADRLTDGRDYDGIPDLFIGVDTPTPDRLKNARSALERARHSVSVDHHVSMQEFADVNLLRESAASTGDIVYDFVRVLGLVPPAGVATCLLTAIITDTGRFQYQNTDTHALRAASQLVEWGASPSLVSERIYQSYPLSLMRLRAQVLQRLSLDRSGRVAYSYVTQEDLRTFQLKPEDCDSLIDVVREVGGVDACVVLREGSAGTVRCNLRAKVDWLDVSDVASTFGGGGHRAAAGLTVVCSLEDAIGTVVGAVSRAVCSHPRRDGSVAGGPRR